MIRMTPLVASVLIVQANVALAHNLFVHVERQLDGPDLIDVFFEHAPFPGDGEYNAPIVERGRTWVRTGEDAKPIPHKLSEITRRGKKFLQGETRTRAPRAIEHACKWGVYRGRLDYFYGKYLEVKTLDELRQLGRARELPLDLVPQAKAGRLIVQVLWKGDPRAKATVHVWPPGGRERKYQANEEGMVRISDPKRGLYSFSCVISLAAGEGEFDGQPYKGVMHGVTLRMPWPLE
jgi:hypothetical protein